MKAYHIFTSLLFFFFFSLSLALSSHPAKGVLTSLLGLRVVVPFAIQLASNNHSHQIKKGCKQQSHSPNKHMVADAEQPAEASSSAC
jgi:hypothetical protein